MRDFTNRTYDEISVGQSEAVTRTLNVTDIEALALAAGDVDGYHHDQANPDDRPSAQAAAAIAMIAGILNRRLPGPGSAIVGTHFEYVGDCFIGDTLTATVTVRAKHDDGHRIDFECTCRNQHGETLVDEESFAGLPFDSPKHLRQGRVADVEGDQVQAGVADGLPGPPTGEAGDGDQEGDPQSRGGFHRGFEG